ncbi:MAG TPA: metallophosphoesterase [Croceibacterium sp.]|nr:metallophosphoesterase [Croceibacterium sp.]
MLALALLALLALAGKAWSDTMAQPRVRRTEVALPGLATPVRIALISDIHVAGPDMPPDRLERIVAQINALEPDLVLIAGDLVSEKRLATHIYAPAEVVAPLGSLDAPLGVMAVPGNHDHWFDMPALAAELRRHGVVLLANQARRAGPLVIGGLDDDYTGRADLPATLAAMDTLPGARLLLSHSPDPFPDLPRSVPLMLAGHTHCGQIAYPGAARPHTCRTMATATPADASRRMARPLSWAPASAPA